jgi:hypothetical protein
MWGESSLAVLRVSLLEGTRKGYRSIPAITFPQREFPHDAPRREVGVRRR